EAEAEDAQKTLEVHNYSGVVLPKGGSNRSHAEYLFTEWAGGAVSSRTGPRVGKITEIVLVLDGKYGPCRSCADDLNFLAESLKRTNEKIQLRIDYQASKAPHPSWENPGDCRAALAAHWQVLAASFDGGTGVEVELVG